eukprot:TRINITY_DN1147_c0_g1_i5.p1 TRINITY_DN1147_c0_g1~~TRINITY_DN1147_c0_g1_i5.p1  ORF type:complete len:212 (-),score=87.87 TRINITY_DN1147_c0_g1_i5:812-1447(-)
MVEVGSMAKILTQSLHLREELGLLRGRVVFERLLSTAEALILLSLGAVLASSRDVSASASSNCIVSRVEEPSDSLQTEEVISNRPTEEKLGPGTAADDDFRIDVNVRDKETSEVECRDDAESDEDDDEDDDDVDDDDDDDEDEDASADEDDEDILQNNGVGDDEGDEEDEDGNDDDDDDDDDDEDDEDDENEDEEEEDEEDEDQPPAKKKK